MVYAIAIYNIDYLKHRIRTACQDIRYDSIVGAINTNLLHLSESCLQDYELQLEHLL